MTTAQQARARAIYEANRQAMTDENGHWKIRDGTTLYAKPPLAWTDGISFESLAGDAEP